MDAAVNEADKVPIPRELSIQGGAGAEFAQEKSP